MKTFKIVNGDISDGYHTFGELYEHGVALYIALCKSIVELGAQSPHSPRIWRSELHSDGIYFDGWFILGIGTEKGKQITYHLPFSKWEETKFAETLDKAPEWDGHTSADVLERLKQI